MAKKDDAEGKKQDNPQGNEATTRFNLAEFLQETKEELGKVVWPSRQQLIGESVSVILMVILSATLIYLVDNFFGWAARQVFG